MGKFAETRDLCAVIHTEVPAGRTLGSHGHALVEALNRRFNVVGCTFTLKGRDADRYRIISVEINGYCAGDVDEEDRIIADAISSFLGFVDGYCAALR